MGVTLYELGILRRMQGRQTEASALLKESLELALENPSKDYEKKTRLIKDLRGLKMTYKHIYNMHM